ncbi:glycosyltransferase family 2 protein [Reichenbachiella versicolor]|uniref:glycosyltransferase family 2 protein n=1 Tax=Reichenbachiella versicolor TaxID=1821036 RepID=UPI000D6DF051|nr:glycosyltransferase family 2 protein [Reichenbachiella versicolor]
MNKENLPEISIIIPLFNEQEVFPILIERINAVVTSLEKNIEVILVDDGSTDQTGVLMNNLSTSTPHYTSVFLSRNFGHEKAISAGLSVAKSTEACFILDGDLQDPPELLPSFIKKMNQGYDITYGIRQNRKENWVLKNCYRLYYRLQKSVATIDIPLDAGDFCLISRRVTDHLNEMQEESLYLRGLRSWTGFKQIGLPYDRELRKGGKSKYSIKLLTKLAFNGLFNFSEFPIRLISKLGFFTISIALIYFFYNLIKKFYGAGVPEGYTSLLFAIILFSGVQLLSLGILGEYIVRVFFQVKKRPLFIIEKVVKKHD